MMIVAEPIKSTSCLPYGRVITNIFRYFGVSLKGESSTRDWSYFGLKNINQLKLEPFFARHSEAEIQTPLDKDKKDERKRKRSEEDDTLKRQKEKISKLATA